MRLGSFDFRPRLIPTLATIVMVGLTAALGRWQVHRAQEKQALLDQYERGAVLAPLKIEGGLANAEQPRFRPVQVEGEFIADKQIFVDNKVENGMIGFHVLTPLRIAKSQDHVLVNRGWVARGKEYPEAPAAPPPSGQVNIVGLAIAPSTRFLELSAETIQGRVWQNLVLSRYEANMGLKALPFVVWQRNDTGDGLPRVAQRPDFGIDRHKGYAFQWFALSFTLIIIYVVLNTKRRA
jgi:surfeit locus 1 family protein